MPSAHLNSSRTRSPIAFGHGSHARGDVVCDSPVTKGRGGGVGIEEQQPLARGVLVSGVAVNGGCELVVASVDFSLVNRPRSFVALAHWWWHVQVWDVE